MDSDFIIIADVLVYYSGHDEDVVIPEGVKKIGAEVFRHRLTMRSITIPDSVEVIEKDAFLASYILEKVIIHDIARWCSISFANSNANPLRFAEHLYLNDNEITSLVIPETVERIGAYAFYGCCGLKSAIIQDSVTTIEEYAFQGCTHLKSIILPNHLKEISNHMLYECCFLKEITIPKNVEAIGRGAFGYCFDIEILILPDGLKEIRDYAFDNCSGLKQLNIPDTVTVIGEGVFRDSNRLETATYDNGLYLGNDKNPYIFFLKAASDSIVSCKLHQSTRFIGWEAFMNCRQLESVSIPENIISVDDRVFINCQKLHYNCYDNAYYLGNADNPYLYLAKAVSKNIHGCSIPESTKLIGYSAFSGCTDITSITIPDNIAYIGEKAFENCDSLVVICQENSNIHKYLEENGIFYIYDYQESYLNSRKLSQIEKLKVPFKADEEKPYIFISYSHKNRNVVFNEIKELYEEGWRIWYDEGLEIGADYDKTLEEHIRNCSVFLLFQTAESAQSRYILQNEIPWATKSFKKPVIQYVLDGESITDINYEKMVTVGKDGLVKALEEAEGLKKGEPRTAEQASVLIDLTEGENKEGFSYCIYSDESSNTAKSILHIAVNKGCRIYNAVEAGADEDQLKKSACITVFLDNAILRNKAFCQLLADELVVEKNTAVWLLEDVELPSELVGLGKLHWLNRLNHDQESLDVMYAEFLEKRGCRSTDCIPDFEYTIDYNRIILTKYTGREENIILPSEYSGMPLTQIGEKLFYNNKFLKTIVIPDSVIKIGKEAFHGCTSLSLVTISQGMQKIEDMAFMGCTSLTSVKIPPGVEKTGYRMFKGCTGLTKVSLPGSMEHIGNRFFEECVNLTSVTIGEGIKTIGSSAFWGCRALSEISLPNSITHIKSSCFYGCTALVDVRPKGDDIRFEELVFEYCDSLMLNSYDNACYLGSNKNPYAYLVTTKNKHFISCEVHEDTRAILPEAFYRCSSMQTVSIPDSVDTIGSDAFKSCEMLNKVIINDLSKWCGITFENQSANPLYFSHHLYKRDTGQEITRLLISDGVSKISDYAFTGCEGILSAEISDSVKEIERSAFSECTNLSSIKLSSGLKTIKGKTFLNCRSLYSITIPDEIEYIGSRAFEGCSGLEIITMPTGLQAIDEDAFKGCDALKKTIIKDVAKWCSVQFYDSFSNPIHQAFRLYIGKKHIKQLRIPDGVTEISRYAFKKCKQLKTVIIPEGVTVIMDEAFAYCSYLTFAIIPDSVSYIGKNAFSGCCNLTVKCSKGSAAEKYCRENKIRLG